LHVFCDEQSAVVLQPHAGRVPPAIQAVPLLPNVMQSWHCPPLPQAELASPATHAPPEQHPPLHADIAEHDVVQIEALHA
jgi:hypothetical protein